MKIERFFHIRPNMNNGGATVRVVGDTDKVGQVDVQVAFCHTHTKPIYTPDGKVALPDRGDPYCRKTGRETASKAPVKIVPLRYLPKELERVWAEAYKKQAGHEYPCPITGHYDFSVKYFLPKE
jgi:hypothetical protein